MIDLKPESHELVELRELLTRLTSVGVATHTFAAFWYVLLLIEVALKLREELGLRLDRDRNALLGANEIDAELEKFGIPSKADFTSRLKLFISRVMSTVRHETERGSQLSADKLTNLVFGDDQRRLRKIVVKYASKNRTLCILFDNLDKGWPVTGVDSNDVLFIRALIDSLNRLQKDFAVDDLECRFSVFLRNDIYDLLIENTSDRGKDGAIPIDWSDREKLKVVIDKRIAASTDSEGTWSTYFPQRIGADDALDHIIDHSLMRPRFLIDIIERSISFAINRNHPTVTAKDIDDAIKGHSYALADEFGYEIRDATGLTNEVLDPFLGADRELPEQAVLQILQPLASSEISAERIAEILIFYGFLGIKSGKSEKYIYDYNYSMRRMLAEGKRLNQALVYTINPAFYVGLAA